MMIRIARVMGVAIFSLRYLGCMGLAVLACGGGRLIAQPPPPAGLPQPTEQQRNELSALYEAAYALDGQGERQAAIAKMEEFERRLKQLQFEKTFESSLTDALAFLVIRRIEAGEFGKARPAAVELGERYRAAPQPVGWKVRASERMLQFIDRVKALAAPEQARVAKAYSESRQIDAEIKSGKVERALPRARECLAETQELLGADDPQTVQVAFLLGAAERASGDLDAAEPRLRRSLDEYLRIYGKGHPTTDRIAGELSRLYSARLAKADAAGDKPAGLALCRTMVETLDAVGGTLSLDLVNSMCEVVRRERELNPPAPLSQIPERLFFDDFSKDSRADYKVVEDVRWQEGSLLVEKGILTRDIKFSFACDLNLLLRYAPAAERPEGVARISYQLASNELVGIRLERRTKEGRTTESLVAEEGAWDEKEGAWRRGDIRAWPLPPGSAEGLWTLRLRGELLEILRDGVHFGYAAHSRQVDARAHQVLIYSEGLSLAIDSWELLAAPTRRRTPMESRLDDAARVYDRLELEAVRRAEYEKAYALRENSHRIRTLLFEPHELMLARSCNAHGFLLQAMGRYDEARPWFDKALAISRAGAGEIHPLTALCWNNSAFLAQQRGETEEAAADYERALRIYYAVHGERHSMTAQLLANLASIYTMQEELEIAREYCARALSIRLEVLGNQSDLTADCLANLSVLAQKQGDLPKALALQEQALDIYLKGPGIGHPKTALALRVAAEILRDLGRVKEAGSRNVTAFSTLQKTLGFKHDWTRGAALSLEKTLEAHLETLHTPAERRPVIEDRIRLCVYLYGEQHWRTGDARRNLQEVQELEKRSDQERQRFDEAHRGALKAQSLAGDKKYAEAAAELSKSLATVSEILGPKNQRYAGLLLILSNYEYRAGDAKQAAAHAEQAAQLFREVYGEKYPNYARVLDQAASIYLESGEVELARERCRQMNEVVAAIDASDTALGHVLEAAAARNVALAKQLELAGRWSEAKEHRAAALKQRIARYGKAHWQARAAEQAAARLERMLQLDAAGKAKLAELAKWKQQAADAAKRDALDDAVAANRQAVRLAAELFGPQSEDAAEAHEAAATAMLRAGHSLDACDSLRSALAAGAALGDDRPATMDRLLLLATAELDLGELGQAMIHGRQAHEICRRLNQERTLTGASILNLLGLLFKETGDPARAAPLLEKSGRILLETEGAAGRHYAMSVSNLSTTYLALNDPRTVETSRKAAELLKQAFGEEHPEYLKIIRGQARSLAATDFAAAKQAAKESLEICLRQLGEGHTDTIDSRQALAAVYMAGGDAAAAAAEYRRAVEAIEQHRAARTRDLSNTLELLALAQLAGGEREAGVQTHLRALRAAQDELAASAAAQSERQQLQFFEQRIDSLQRLIAFTRGSTGDAPAVYEAALAWKGSVLEFQRRRQSLAQDPQLRPLFSQLREITARLDSLLAAGSSEASAAQRKLRDDLTRERETLEQRLAQRVGEVAGREPSGIGLAELQQAIPAGAVLVDCFTYRAPRAGRKESEEHLCAFLVRGEGAIERLELGPTAEMVAAADAWRRSIARGGGGVRGLARAGGTDPRTAGTDAATLLRKQLWEPLEQHLAPEEIVLVSTEGFLNQLPFAALPGKDPEKYLIEERRLALVPSARVLPALLSGKPDQDDAEGSLLLVGDVDFASPGARFEEVALAADAARTRARTLQYDPLPGTAAEIDAIAKLYAAARPKDGISLLRRDGASESAVRTAAPAHRYLHFATHGFFLPESETAAAGGGPRGGAAALPGIYSGLVLAGANRGVEFSLANPTQLDNGVLTAAELADLDLRQTRLVVLSACETGLGEAACGEGMLGLQRSLHAAGVESVVASLWNVDDEATSALMVEFYRNLLQRKLGRLDALREAQLALLHGKLVRPVDVEQDRSRPATLPPRYWAAFFLSGDWR